MLVVSGPSGVGKSSVVDGLARERTFHFSVSCTTRNIRPGERDGVDYHFLERSDFEGRIAADDFLEWANYSGNMYGTLRSEVLDHLDAGHNVLLDIENDGARQIKARFPDAVTIFLLPPSLEELGMRLRKRGDTSDDDVARRLSVAEAQIADAEANFDHLVVNDDLRTAIAEVVSILDSYPVPTR